MLMILLLIALTVVLALAAPLYGVDSRDLDDHSWEAGGRPAHPGGW